MDQVFSKLTELIRNSENVVIMTHRNPDFDGMGSAIALQQIIHSFKIDSYICVDKDEIDTTLTRAFDYMKKRGLYHKMVSKKEVDKIINENTLLIILDTHKKDMVEFPELLDISKNIAIIDHHIKSKEAIKKAVFTYINSKLSSIIELMVNYLKFLNKQVDPLTATIMEIGLEIDTNNFKLKTTDKTFEVAAFLSKMGADNILKQELLKEEKDIFIKRNRIIETSFMVKPNMAMCITDDLIYETKDLATIAEELLQFENVEASFVIGKINDNTIGISARSIGNINVLNYMSKLGGGGHFNEAATQIKDTTIQFVKDKLIKTIGG